MSPAFDPKEVILGELDRMAAMMTEGLKIARSIGLDITIRLDPEDVLRVVLIPPARSRNVRGD